MRSAASLMLLTTLPAMAADTLLETCVAIGDDRARLACYDEVAGRAGPEARWPVPATQEPAAQLPATPTTQKPAAQLPAPPAAPEIAAPPPAPATLPATLPAPARAPLASADDDFGLDRERGNDQREIQSRLDGEFTGWSGRTLFKLENGQVWRQSEPGRFRAQIDRPLITIERGAFNSYRLKVDGMNRSIRVKRVR